MKIYIDTAIGLISLLIIALFFYYRNEFLILKQFDLLAIRNYLFFNIGTYFFFLLKSKRNSSVRFPYRYLFGDNLGKSQYYLFEFKEALFQPGMIIMVFTYATINTIMMIDFGYGLLMIFFDLLLLGFQYLFFLWLMLFLKNLFKNEGVNIIMIMCNAIVVLSFAGRAFDQNIYFLLNPFVGWINFIDILPINFVEIKLLILISLMLFVGLIIIFLTKKLILHERASDDSL
jgi:hypothetical protein